MMSHDLRARVPQGSQEVRVRIQDRAVQIEADHGLGAVDGRDLTGIPGGAEHRFRDIGRIFDNSDRPAGLVEDRVVGRFDPNFTTILTKPRELGRDELAIPQPAPKLGIGRAGRIGACDEHCMLLSDHLLRLIPHEIEEAVIRLQNGAIGGELDDGIRALHGGKPPLQDCRLPAEGCVALPSRSEHPNASSSSNGTGLQQAGRQDALGPTRC